MIENGERRFIPEQFVLQENRPPIVLLLHGKNIGIQYSPARIAQEPSHLSVHSRLIAQAGAAVYKQGDFLIFSCGKTSGPEVASEAQLLYDHAKRFNSQIPGLDDPQVVLQEESLTTPDDALRNIPILREHNLAGAFLLSTGFHVPRLTITYQHFAPDMSFHGVSADEILLRSDPRMRSVIISYRWSLLYQAERVKEALILGSMIFDREGKILNKVTSKRGE